MAERIRLSRTKGWRLRDISPNAVKVDRSTAWGNPYSIHKLYGEWSVRRSSTWGPVSIGRFATEAEARTHAVELFRQHVNNTPSLLGLVREHLAGKDLACWCKTDEPCHADVLLSFANGGDHD